MATVTHAAVVQWSTTAGNKNYTATPAAGDLIVVFTASTGATTTALTDNNPDGLGTYTKIGADRTGWDTTGFLSVWVRNALIGNAVSTVWTATQAGSTGGGLDVFRVAGMTRTGAPAVRQSAGQSSGTSGTAPAPVMGTAVLTANPVVGAVCCGTNSTANFTPRTGYTEATDAGYGTPAAGFETIFRSSGETATTLTWGSNAPSAFGSLMVELDTSPPETSPALEASGFGTFAGVSPGDTINSVTATVAQWASTALMAAPVYQLWDGTASQIGADAAGSVSTSTANTDSPSWTGVTYSQLATLRLRVTAHQGAAPAGATQSVDYVALTVNYTPSAAASAPAGLAAATATAPVAAARLAPAPPAAGAAGTAPAAGTGHAAQAGPAQAAAAAPVPVTGLSVQAGLAGAVGTAPAALAAAKVQPAAPAAAAAAPAPAAGTAAATAAPAGLAAAAAAAPAAQPSVAAQAGPAAATATAPAPVMPLALRAAKTVTTGGGSLTLAVPAQPVQVGDLIFIWAAAGFVSMTFTSAAGDNLTAEAANSPAAPAMSTQLFWRIADASDVAKAAAAGSYTITISTSHPWSAAIGVVPVTSAAHPYDPSDTPGSGQSNTASLSVTAAGVTTANSPDLLVWLGASRNTAGGVPPAITPPAGYAAPAGAAQANSSGSGTANTGVVLATATQPAAGATGTQAGTIGASQVTAGLLLAVKAAPVTAVPGTVAQLAAGAPAADGFGVVAKTSGATTCRLAYSVNADMSSPSYLSAQTPDSSGYVRFTASGLAARTRYYVQVTDTPAGGTETLIGPAGQVKTLPAAGVAQSFTAALVSCINRGDVTTPAQDTAIADWIGYDADLNIFTGDFDYSGTTSTDTPTQVGVYESQIAGVPSLAAMVSTRWGYYCRSDHESGPDNGDSNNAYTATNIAAAQAVFPFGALGDASTPPHGLYQAWVAGRVRFIMLDIRNTDRSPGGSTDNAAKTMLGAAQLAWLETQLIQPEPLKVIISDVAWMGPASITNGPDKWWSYATERQAIIDYIAANRAAVGGVMLWHGDSHLVGATPGPANSYGGFPVYCAAPMLNVGGGLNTGTFTQLYNNAGGECRLYGRIAVTDTGTTITVTFTGWDAAAGVARVTQTDVFAAGPAQATATAPDPGVVAGPQPGAAQAQAAAPQPAAATAGRPATASATAGAPQPTIAIGPAAPLAQAAATAGQAVPAGQAAPAAATAAGTAPAPRAALGLLPPSASSAGQAAQPAPAAAASAALAVAAAGAPAPSVASTGTASAPAGSAPAQASAPPPQVALSAAPGTPAAVSAALTPAPAAAAQPGSGQAAGQAPPPAPAGTARAGAAQASAQAPPAAASTIPAVQAPAGLAQAAAQAPPPAPAGSTRPGPAQAGSQAPAPVPAAAGTAGLAQAQAGASQPTTAASARPGTAQAGAAAPGPAPAVTAATPAAQAQAAAPAPAVSTVPAAVAFPAAATAVAAAPPPATTLASRAAAGLAQAQAAAPQPAALTARQAIAVLAVALAGAPQPSIAISAAPGRATAAASAPAAAARAAALLALLEGVTAGPPRTQWAARSPAGRWRARTPAGRWNSQPPHDGGWEAGSPHGGWAARQPHR